MLRIGKVMRGITKAVVYVYLVIPILTLYHAFIATKTDKNKNSLF